VRRPIATVAIAALVAGAAFTSSGCGVQTGVAPSGGADLAHGQQLFISTCGGCERRVRDALSELHGVSSVVAEHIGDEVEVTFDEAAVGLDQIRMAIIAEGFAVA